MRKKKTTAILRRKKIEAVIQFFKLEDVRQALTDNNIRNFTVWEVRGFGRKMIGSAIYREPDVDDTAFIPKVKIEIVVLASEATKTVEVILKMAKTGKPGDGTIFVSDVGAEYSIRTGKRKTH